MFFSTYVCGSSLPIFFAQCDLFCLFMAVTLRHGRLPTVQSCLSLSFFFLRQIASPTLSRSGKVNSPP
ncbi:hypothetical protein BJY00DRAFT_283453 [Aspergillus carlsbadensis]|nr:hypothetical protein BJY00DRAFT_283453 [Aspergillus carlsbadensis]